MSILLVALPEDLAAATVRRLVAQGDEVRFLASDRAGGEFARKLGAFVALGSPENFDLIERAAQNVRTIVFGDGLLGAEAGEGLFFGGKNARVGRWIYVCGIPDPALRERMREAEADYVVLATGRKGLLGGKTPAPTAVAEAIDAADDLAGDVRLELDLNEPEGWTSLLLEPH